MGAILTPLIGPAIALGVAVAWAGLQEGWLLRLLPSRTQKPAERDSEGAAE